MGKIKAWTRQHSGALEILRETGRYTAKKEYIAMDMEEHADIVFLAYDWLVRNGPGAANRPRDVQYPVWVTFDETAAMPAGSSGVVLELVLEEADVTFINIAKWGAILNYSYIPKDGEDAKRHRELLALYRTDDVRSVMTPFYPELRREILGSWQRLFDESVVVGNALCYGTVWELRREWITGVRHENS